MPHARGGSTGGRSELPPSRCEVRMRPWWNRPEGHNTSPYMPTFRQVLGALVLSIEDESRPGGIACYPCRSPRHPRGPQPAVP
jgi:hypothetical protein